MNITEAEKDAAIELYYGLTAYTVSREALAAVMQAERERAARIVEDANKFLAPLAAAIRGEHD